MTTETKCMQVRFAPIRSDRAYNYEKRGAALVINGEIFDFADLPDGAMLPADAVQSEAVCGDVHRKGNTLYLALHLAHGVDAPAHMRFPDAVTVTEDGPIVAKEAQA